MARQPCGQDPPKASAMAATVLAIRRARPAVSAMSSQSFETSTPMHNGPATAERSVEAGRRRATMAHLRKKGKVLWRRIVTRGGPGLPFALKTEKGRTTDRDCLRLVFHPESISPSCPPFLPQTKRTARQNVQSRERGTPYGPWIASLAMTAPV